MNSINSGLKRIPWTSWSLTAYERSSTSESSSSSRTQTWHCVLTLLHQKVSSTCSQFGLKALPHSRVRPPSRDKSLIYGMTIAIVCMLPGAVFIDFPSSLTFAPFEGFCHKKISVFKLQHFAVLILNWCPIWRSFFSIFLRLLFPPL